VADRARVHAASAATGGARRGERQVTVFSRAHERRARTAATPATLFQTGTYCLVLSVLTPHVEQQLEESAAAAASAMRLAEHAGNFFFFFFFLVFVCLPWRGNRMPLSALFSIQGALSLHAPFAAVGLLNTVGPPTVARARQGNTRASGGRGRCVTALVVVIIGMPTTPHSSLLFFPLGGCLRPAPFCESNQRFESRALAHPAAARFFFLFCFSVSPHKHSPPSNSGHTPFF